VFWYSLQLLSETFLIPRTNERDMIAMSSCEVPVTLVRFSWNLNFLDQFSKICSNIKFHKNSCIGSPHVPCGRADWQMDRQLTVAFRNFANAPKDSCKAPDFCEQNCLSTGTIDSGTSKTNYQLTTNRINRNGATGSLPVPVSTIQHDFWNIQPNNIAGQLQTVFE